MPPRSAPLIKGLAKAPTGIPGFDEATRGGLPQGRTTLLVGGPGSGKTVLALQFLAHGANAHKEPGIFVAFEETANRIVENAESFGWGLVALTRQKKLVFIDAYPGSDIVNSGNFDLGGMLAALDLQVKTINARRIVFDALDVVLALLPDLASQRRELYRLHDWLLAHQLTGLLSAKTSVDGTRDMGSRIFDVAQFMVDCAVILSHRAVQGVSQRNLRVLKYRGSGFDENEAPFLIGNQGLEVAVTRAPGHVSVKATRERVSSGVERLDTMLGGGYFRGASILITGFSGTAKTTLSAVFAEAACQRGERTLFVSFDSEYSEVIRNLRSVGIRLERFVKSGILRMISARTIAGSAETYLVRIKAFAKEHQASCIVIDPVSQWSSPGSDMTPESVADRLIHWAKGDGTTVVCTNLLDELSFQMEGDSQLQISALADTWIHLNYAVQAGERNRGLSIIKSRGTAHSNQVRELILTDQGVTLADTYTAGGEVLMGTLRWQKESAERRANAATEVDGKRKRVKLNAEEAELELRLKALQTELLAKQAEKDLSARTTESKQRELSKGRTQMKESRGADSVKPGQR